MSIYKFFDDLYAKQSKNRFSSTKSGRMEIIISTEVRQQRKEYDPSLLQLRKHPIK
jgi:hypothetical protein